MSEVNFESYFDKPPQKKTTKTAPATKAISAAEPEKEETGEFVLTNENYYSRQANRLYMSVSQYKGFLSCEAAALAELNGEYEREEKEVFLVGNYLHAWAQGPEYLDRFVENNPEIISSKGATKGELKAPFKVADKMIAALQGDQKVMFYLQGEKELPINAMICGVPWKGKLDVLNDKLNYILDIKTAQSITDFKYVPAIGGYASFIEQYNYMLQAAIYCEMERVAAGREGHKDFYIAVVTKEDPPDHAIINLTDPVRIETELQDVAARLPRIIKVKAGELEPDRCECCRYCRRTKKVGELVFYSDLREGKR